MASLRAAVRARWREGEPLARVLAKVNEILLQTVPPNRFATLFLARADTATGEVLWVNAGHAAPLVARSDGSHEVLEATGTILGVFPGISWEERRTRLGPGDVLVLLSDGVMEAAREAEGDLGPERLAAVARAAGRSASVLLGALQAAAEESLGGARRADDHTFVVLRRTDDS
jgi:serine phosphatase RsbU (regulator of sigma subunit)